MGQVYLAVKDDDQFERFVAVKVIRKALSIRLRLLGKEHPDVASGYAHLGNLFRYKGALEEAESRLLNINPPRKCVQ